MNWEKSAIINLSVSLSLIGLFDWSWPIIEIVGSHSSWFLSAWLLLLDMVHIACFCIVHMGRFHAVTLKRGKSKLPAAPPHEERIGGSTCSNKIKHGSTLSKANYRALSIQREYRKGRLMKGNLPASKLGDFPSDLFMKAFRTLSVTIMLCKKLKLWMM